MSDAEKKAAEREARRQRILERSANRLDYITGRSGGGDDSSSPTMASAPAATGDPLSSSNTADSSQENTKRSTLAHTVDVDSIPSDSLAVPQSTAQSPSEPHSLPPSTSYSTKKRASGTSGLHLKRNAETKGEMVGAKAAASLHDYLISFISNSPNVNVAEIPLTDLLRYGMLLLYGLCLGLAVTSSTTHAEIQALLFTIPLPIMLMIMSLTIRFGTAWHASGSLSKLLVSLGIMKPSAAQTKRTFQFKTEILTNGKSDNPSTETATSSLSSSMALMTMAFKVFHWIKLCRGVFEDVLLGMFGFLFMYAGGLYISSYLTLY